MDAFTLNYNCGRCWDSTLVSTFFGLTTCDCWRTPGRIFPQATWLLRQIAQVRGLHQTAWDVNLVDTARILVHGTAALPVPGKFLQAHLGLDRRAVSELVRVLRTDWTLPIVAPRSTGYWIATTVKEFEENERAYRRQALTMLKSSYNLRQANYPQLAGQTFFEFLEEEEEFDGRLPEYLPN